MDLIIVLLSLLAATGVVVYVGWTLGEDAVVPTSGYVAHTSEGHQKGGTRGIEGFANAGKSALDSVNTDRPGCLSNHLQYLCEAVLLGSPPRELME
jgi:hypothetical protein